MWIPDDVTEPQLRHEFDRLAVFFHDSQARGHLAACAVVLVHIDDILDAELARRAAA